MFYDLKMIVLMKENVFSYFKTIWSILKNFQNWPKKNLRGDLRTKGGTIGKKFFSNMFLWFENDCFDERNVFSYFKTIWSILKNFQNWPEKNLRGDLRTKGGTIGKKKFFSNMFYDLKMIVLMKENVFSYFKSIWSILKIFQNWSKKNLRGDLRTKGGTIGKNFFQTCFYDLKMIVLMKENVFSYFKTIWSILKNFQNCRQKKFKGWPQDQRGDHWKKFFFKHVFMIWKWLFWWKETFFHILKQFEAYWKIFKTGRKKI